MDDTRRPLSDADVDLLLSSLVPEYAAGGLRPSSSIVRRARGSGRLDGLLRPVHVGCDGSEEEDGHVTLRHPDHVPDATLGEQE